MEEKKPMKIRLSTVVLSIIILALIGGLVYFIYQNNKLQKTKEENASEIKALQSKTEQLEKTIEEVRNITTTPEVNSTENTTSTISNPENKYKEITSELIKEELFLFQDLEKNGETYTLKGIIQKPYTVTEDELKNIVSTGKMILDNEEYIVKKDEQGRYGLYPKGYDVEHYFFRQDKDTYYLESNTEYPTVWKATEDYRKITLSGNTKCTYSLDSYNDKTDTVANVFSKKLYFGGKFKFKFDSGKCVEVYEIVTGH